LAQVLGQPVVAHWNAPQATGAAGGQVPLPSQVTAGVKALVVVLQDAGMQILLVLTLRQAPAPSQVPSFPH
jgi:hypothetical protein